MRTLQAFHFGWNYYGITFTSMHILQWHFSAATGDFKVCTSSQSCHVLVEDKIHSHIILLSKSTLLHHFTLSGLWQTCNNRNTFCSSAILCSRADSLRSHEILHEWLAFYSVFLNIHWGGVHTALAWLEPHETAAVSARSVYTIQPRTISLHAKPHT